MRLLSTRETHIFFKLVLNNFKIGQEGLYAHKVENLQQPECTTLLSHLTLPMIYPLDLTSLLFESVKGAYKAAKAESVV